MKRLVFFILVMLAGVASKAQQFRRLPLINLGDTTTAVQAAWVAINADTLLDVVLLGQTLSGELQLTTFRNEGGDTLVRMHSSLTGLLSARFELDDWNRDNFIDLLVSGRTASGPDETWYFENKGDFTFEKHPSPIIGFGAIVRVADLDANCTDDLIVAGETTPGIYSLRVFERDSSRDILRLDTTGINVSDIIVFDENRDGRMDFAVSGESSGVPVTLIFINKGNYHFSISTLPDPVRGDLSMMDLNKDGALDIVCAGMDESGNWKATAWQNRSDIFTTLRSFPAPPNPQLFVGDMNSDGVPDWVLHGGGSSFVLDSARRILLDSMGLILQSMGDMDRDGDLDIVQAVDSAGAQWIRLLINESPPNAPPSAPPVGFAITFSNRTFIIWQPGQDDHTPWTSLTYDVWLGKDGKTLINPTFQLATGLRMQVVQGNAGSSAGIMIRNLTDDLYYYDIRSVDNAYNGSYGGGNCSGSVVACFEISHEEVQGCENENVTLKPDSDSYWFKSTGEYLGYSSSLSFIPVQGDTVYSVQPLGSSCAQNKTWVINVNPPVTNLFEEVNACLAAKVQFGIVPGWVNVEWNTIPKVLGIDTIEYVVNGDTTIIATGTSSGGCQIRKEFNIHVSNPEVTVGADMYRIMRGQSVQLQASAPSGSFAWTPSTGLNDPGISDPIASPAQTTTYTVTLTDSIGCSATATVIVQVEENAFVPNLFTPNGDGTNDVLLIYGLTTASTFRFRIFNREGSTVYETDDVSQATVVGWNGTTGGALQPSGLYYWKVEGQAPTGSELTLNGKKTGSILLVR